MIFHPIIDELAQLPLTLLVTPAQEQHDEHETACFCPFCRDASVGKDSGVKRTARDGSDTPHFIIYKEERGGLYGGGGALRWRCSRTGRSGYGAIELYAAIHSGNGCTLHGDGLRRTCLGLMMAAGYDKDRIRAEYPELLTTDVRGYAETPIEGFDFQLKADFTPQELYALGCETRVGRSGFDYTFGGRSLSRNDEGDDSERTNAPFSPADINRDFRIYSILECTFPARRVKGEKRSRTMTGTPWCPLFVCFANDKHDCGCVFRPTTDDVPIVFSNTDDHTVSKVSRWLGGDRVFTAAVDYRDGHTTGVKRAIGELAPEEQYRTTRKEWQEIEGERGGTKWQQIDVDLKNDEIKARCVLFCDSPQDAVATYYNLRAFRQSRPDNETLQDLCWAHTAFLIGGRKFRYMDHGEWKDSAVQFSGVQHGKLIRFADKAAVFFPHDMRSMRRAAAIVTRYSDLALATLPDAFASEITHKDKQLFGRVPHTVRDWCLCYTMTEQERKAHGTDLREYLYAIAMKSALPIAPLERKEKRNASTGALREVYYTVDSATVWKFLMCHGYYRSVDLATQDRIGQFVILDGPFVEPVSRESMVALAYEALRTYAVKHSRDDEDYRLMLQGIDRASREVNELKVSQLPAINLDYAGAFGPKLDHFFFRNCALRITPDEIRPVSYDDIDFNVDRRSLMPFDFYMPYDVPFSISRNPEADVRRKELQEKSKEVDANGRSRYSRKQVSVMQSEFNVWNRTHEWLVDWKGRAENKMWPALRVLRGFSNIRWENEEDLLRQNKQPTEEDASFLASHFANLLFGIGRVLWRYRSSASNSIPYLMENKVADNNRSQGGTGKSSLVNVFAGCAGQILYVDCKKITRAADMQFVLGEYQENVHRIVHWEDWTKSCDLNVLYNYSTSGFVYERKHVDSVRIDINRGPGHVVSSNFAISGGDDSTMRRLVMVPFSDRFCGENVLKNQSARLISDLMPDFSSSGIDTLTQTSKCQIAYIDALAVQFVMRYDCKVNAPLKDVKHRTMVNDYGQPFVNWADYFFAQTGIFGCVQDMQSMYSEYVRDFTDASEGKKSLYSLREFKRKVVEYCEHSTPRITMNPPHLLVNKKDQQQNYLHLKAWCTQEYFFGREWEGDKSISPKLIRELVRTDKGVVFYRDSDEVPESYEKFIEQYNEWCRQPDTSPMLDSEGKPVELTQQEKFRWDKYKMRQQGNSSPVYTNPDAASMELIKNMNGGTLPGQTNDEDLPF